ncbi:MAG: hypothetical protein JW801_05965 [Bacteroidales bacterium]|nr:hypothetical protein [Bacteroidales bacterium]
MKKVVLSFIFLSLFLIQGCEKESRDPEDNSSRVREIIFQDDDVPYRKLEFIYGTNEMTQINHYFMADTAWKQDYISEFSNTDEGYVHEFYYLNRGERKFKRRNIYNFEDDRLVEDIYYVGSKGEWFLNSRWNYEYEDDKLTHYTIYHYTNGTWNEKIQAYFTYRNDEIQEHNYFEILDGQRFQTDRDTFFWKDGRLSEYLDYNRKYGKLELNSRSIFSWTGDQTTKIDLFSRQNDDWHLHNSTQYHYDEEGRLTSEKNHWGDEMLVFYEEGKGNFSMIYYMPELIAFNKPMFKDADEAYADDSVYLPADILKPHFFPLK